MDLRGQRDQEQGTLVMGAEPGRAVVRIRMPIIAVTIHTNVVVALCQAVF